MSQRNKITLDVTLHLTETNPLPSGYFEYVYRFLSSDNVVVPNKINLNLKVEPRNLKELMELHNLTDDDLFNIVKEKYAKDR
jgi:hypothetical protein